MSDGEQLELNDYHRIRLENSLAAALQRARLAEQLLDEATAKIAMLESERRGAP